MSQRRGIRAETVAPRRRRLRLPAFDYSTPGAYFFTIVTLNRELVFGRVRGTTMEVNSAGDAVLAAWLCLPDRSDVELDAFVVMPNQSTGSCGYPREAQRTRPESSRWHR